MRSNKNTLVTDVEVFCGDCGEFGFEPITNDPWMWAKIHARDTGHIPTVRVQYDVYPEPAETEDVINVYPFR